MGFFEDITNPQDLDMLSKERLIAFLKSEHVSKVRLWNGWRRDNDWEAVDLAETDLAGADLRDISLSLCDLTRANLEGARLDKAQLNGTLLRGANLAGVSLVGVALNRAELTACSLRGADVSGVDFSTVATINGAALLAVDWRDVAGLDAGLMLQAPIGELAAGRFREAVDAYRGLRRALEWMDDCQYVDQVYRAERQAAALAVVPDWMRWAYPRYQNKFTDEFSDPRPFRWARLTLGGAISGWGTGAWRPLAWLAGLIVIFALVYLIGGVITDIPGCGFVEYNARPIEGCTSSRNLFDALLYSIGAALWVDVNTLRPYYSNVWMVEAIEAIAAVLLIGMTGAALGRRIRR